MRRDRSVLATIEARLAHDVPMHRDAVSDDGVMRNALDAVRTIMRRCRRSRADAGQREACAHDRDEKFLFETHNALLFVQLDRRSRPFFRKDYGRRAVNAL